MYNVLPSYSTINKSVHQLLFQLKVTSIRGFCLSNQLLSRVVLLFSVSIDSPKFYLIYMLQENDVVCDDIRVVVRPFVGLVRKRTRYVSYRYGLQIE